MSISGLFQFVLGFMLGIFLLAGSSAAILYYIFTQMAALPPKPVFIEETSVTATPKTKQPETKDSTENKEELEPGAYKARVTWPEGLILRQEPTVASERLGGIAFDREIIVLQLSEDKQWQKVRIPQNNQKGWIKAGNVKKVEE